MRRSTITDGALALVTVGALALTACTTPHNTNAGANGKPAKAPAAELADAVTRLKADTFTMTVTLKIDNLSAQLTGVMDPARKVGSFTSTTENNGRTTTAEWRLLGNVVYLKSSTPSLLGDPSKPWRKIDQPTTGSGLADSLDGTKLAEPLGRALTVRRNGDRHFAGTFDIAAVAKALSLSTPVASPSTPQASKVAYTAVLDNNGRLTHYHLDVPRTQGATYPMNLTFSNFGTPLTVKAPPADQVMSSTGNRLPR